MRSHIDHSNYEAWLLDRLEGVLTAEQETMLDAFLEANPGLRPDLDELPSLKGSSPSLPQVDKDALKRTLPPEGPPTEPLDDFLIAQLENDLAPGQMKALDEYLARHPRQRHSQHLYTFTRTKPEPLSFPDKASLMRALPPAGMPARDTLEDFLVAWLEGDLLAGQEEALAAYLRNDETAQRQWTLMQQARVQREDLWYPDKDALKKGGKVVAIGTARASWAVRLRVAATVAILLGMGIWTLDNEPADEPRLATIDEQGVTIRKDTPAPPAEEAGQKPAPKPRPLSTAPAERSGPDNSLAGLHTKAHPLPEEQGLEEEARGRRMEPIPVMEPLAVLPITEMPGHRPLEADPFDLPASSMEHDDTPKARMTLPQGITLWSLLAGKLRERVLDKEGFESRPLDGEDALAAMDKGLKAVGGGHAGIDVQRTYDGRPSIVGVHLGRNLSISAGR